MTTHTSTWHIIAHTPQISTHSRFTNTQPRGTTVLRDIACRLPMKYTVKHIGARHRYSRLVLQLRLSHMAAYGLAMFYNVLHCRALAFQTQHQHESYHRNGSMRAVLKYATLWQPATVAQRALDNYRAMLRHTTCCNHVQYSIVCL